MSATTTAADRFGNNGSALPVWRMMRTSSIGRVAAVAQQATSALRARTRAWARARAMAKAYEHELPNQSMVINTIFNWFCCMLQKTVAPSFGQQSST